MTTPRFLLLCSLAAMAAAAVGAFSSGAPPALPASRGRDRPRRARRTRLSSDPNASSKSYGKAKFGERTDADVSRFLTDFRTADGAVVDPYRMLRLSRGATPADVKRSYRRLSRKLHPDMAARSDVLPGRCTTLEEVREEWERVKFSYEILSDPKTRKKYDRNSRAAEALDNPGGAVGRAVAGTAMNGVGLVLGGVWKLGEKLLGQ